MSNLTRDFRATDAAVQFDGVHVSAGVPLTFVALGLGAATGWLSRSRVVHPVYADRMTPTRRQVVEAPRS